jgi:hypothetical protein
MSMMAQFVQVTPDLLNELMEDDSRVAELFMPDSIKSRAQVHIPEQLRKQAMARLPQMLASTADRMPPNVREALEQRLKALGTSLEELQTGKGTESVLQMMERSRERLMSLGAGAGGGASALTGKRANISLDKAWHGLHYLMCGQMEPDSTPLGQAVLGGTEIGDDDSGYGPARFFSVQQVAQIARELASPGLETAMTARFDPRKMNDVEIYPRGWDTAGALNWLLEEFHHLRDFYAEASARKFAIITCIV